MPQDQDQGSDAPLTAEQERYCARLSGPDVQSIDAALRQAVAHDWQKVARVVGSAMSSVGDKLTGVPDVFYARRLHFLARSDGVEIRGALSSMRLSEVRLPRIQHIPPA